MRGITDIFRSLVQSPVVAFSGDVKKAHNKAQENLYGFTNEICQHFTPVDYMNQLRHDNYKLWLGEGLREMPSLEQLKDFITDEKGGKLSFTFEVNDTPGDTRPASVTLKKTSLADEYLLSTIIAGYGTTNIKISFNPDDILQGVRSWLNDLLPVNQRFKNAEYRCDLKDKWLEGIILQKISMREVDVSRSRLANSILNESNFSQAIMVGTVFYHAEMRQCLLCYADLTDADLRFADLAGADLRGARLKGVCFTGARLVDLQNDLRAHLDRDSLLDIIEAIKKGRASPDILRGINLSGADLSDLNLENLDLRHAIMKGMSIENASLVGTLLEHATLDEVSTKTVLKAIRGGRANPDILCGCFISKITLTGMNFSGILLQRCDFTSSHLENALFNGANVTDAIFRSAYLHSAQFNKAIMKNAQCQSADMEFASVREAIVDGANFEGTNLYRANFLGTSLFNNFLHNALLDCASLSPGTEFYLMGAVSRGEATVEIFRGLERHLIKNIIRPTDSRHAGPSEPTHEEVARLNTTQQVMNVYRNYLTLPCFSSIVNNPEFFSRPQPEDVYLQDDEPNVLLSSQNTEVLMICTAAVFRKIRAAECLEAYNSVKWFVKNAQKKYVMLNEIESVDMFHTNSPYFYSLYNSALKKAHSAKE